MSYKSKVIKAVIVDIEASKVYLPALQRKFVWKRHQIELLFDSLMRNFPIGTFLFWNLKRENAQNYVFYEFLKEYDQRNPYNKRKEGAFLNPEIIGVLDGQQRLSSIYIALQGTHTEKAPHLRWTNDDAFHPTKLYLNVLSLPYYLDGGNIETYEDKNFEFRFLTDSDAQKHTRRVKQINSDGTEVFKEETAFWFKVGSILTWSDDPEFDEIINGFLSTCQEEVQISAIREKKRFIKKGLEILFKRITKEELINYFEIDKKDLEDILKIFIRVNSGGTPLGKTDLLFSTIVATWDNGREEIENLLKKINSKGDGFNFSNEYLMRCCLVLTDAPVLYKVNSFKSENVEKIKSQWGNIASAISKTTDLLVEYGFSGSLLPSQNVTIMIAYYILKNGLIDENSRLDIKRYLIHALLNKIYGDSQEQVITSLRNFLRVERKDVNGKKEYVLKRNSFSFNDLLKVELPSKKSFYITEKEIEGFLSYKKGVETFFVLSLLYPNLRYKEVQFHQDHIHPASHFTNEKLDSLNIPFEDRQEWFDKRDMLPNLQLLEGRQNESKNATEFRVWLNNKNESEKQLFCNSNFIPLQENLYFLNFNSFFDKRKEMLRTELKMVLAINNAITRQPTDFDDEEQNQEEVDDSIQ